MTRLLILILISSPLFAQVKQGELNHTDKNGKKQGQWEKYFPESEVKRYEGQFKDDKPFGTFKYYYSTGEVRAVLNYHKDNRSTVKNYYPNGELMAVGAYVDTLKDSTWTYYSQYGDKLAIDYYIVGKKYGNSQKFHPNGQLLQEKYFENNLENGAFREYYEDGIMSREATYVNGSLEGESTFYHANGEVRFQGSYFKDTKHGIWKTYDDKGNLVDERMYTKGIPEYRESDVLFEDSTKYYKKDVLRMEDFIEEDYMAIPPDDKKKKKK